MSHRPRLDLAFLLNQSAFAFTAQLETALQGAGVNLREYCVLMKAAEEERTQNALAELAMLDKSTMVTTLDGLEKSGLARRRVSETDRRARIVTITDAGRRVLADATELYDAAVDATLGDLDGDVRAAFIDALTRLTDGRWATPSHTRGPARALASRK